MKKIQIQYNPFSQKTALRIDGHAQTPEGGRFQEYVIWNSMERWLPPGRTSYRRWDGFLPELMDMLNEDALEIVFAGTREDARCFRQELTRQQHGVEDRGYDPNLYSLRVEEWNLQNIQGSLRQFSDLMEANLLTGTAHKRLLLVRELLKEEPSTEKLKLCRTLALEIIQDSLDFCAGQENPAAEIQASQVFWAEANSSIHQIFQA